MEVSPNVIDLYVGINETKWNHHPVAPGPLACISPVYGSSTRTKKENSIRVPGDTAVIQDSGAFCDGPGDRLDFQSAYQRQIDHAEKYKYAKQVTHMASYDLLIDEKWTDGQRRKERWSENEAEAAVKETVAAADWIRGRTNFPVILSAQGVTATQYLKCTQEVAPMVRPCDMFGLGGWCIIGKRPKQMMPVFRETIRLVIPFLAQTDVDRVHIWGVCYGPALGELLWMCDQHGLRLSTDSAGPQRRPAFGVWGYKGWVDKSYQRPSVSTRGLERARHVRATREWLSNFRGTEFYQEPLEPSKEMVQLNLL